MILAPTLDQDTIVRPSCPYEGEGNTPRKPPRFLGSYMHSVPPDKVNEEYSPMRLSSSSYPVPRLELGENGQRQRHFLPHMFVELTLMISLNLGY
jgi:hypothetical protein